MKMPPKKPRLLYDGWAMFLELLVGACIVTIVAAFMNLRRDEQILVFCAPAFLIGVFALRFRLHRRAWPERQSPSRRHQNASSGKVVFDWLSVFLEMLVVGCGILVVALMIDGDDDFLPLGVSATVLGLLAVRFRLHRRASAASSLRIRGPLTKLDALSVVLELFAGVCVVVIVSSLFLGGRDRFVVSTVFGALGVVALRFRFARRLVPHQPGIGDSASSRNQPP